MNIYDFFNSHDVAEYCRGIGHTFNAVESAVMVYTSIARTLAERHAAYRTIIAEYPDMEVPAGEDRRRIKSFHKALGSVIAYEERLLEKFLSAEQGAVYLVSINFTSNKERDFGDFEEQLFSTYEKALLKAQEFFDDNDEEYLKYRFPHDFMNANLEICKKYLDGTDYIDVRVNRSGEILSVNCTRGIAQNLGGKNTLYLSDIYIDVPVPFKRGDLVEYVRFEPWWMGGDYVGVLQSICRDDPKENAQKIYRGDCSEMTALMYSENNGVIRCERVYFYPNLRYSRRKLEGTMQILKYLSLYMQNKLCLCSLFKTQRFFELYEGNNSVKCFENDETGFYISGNPVYHLF